MRGAHRVVGALAVRHDDVEAVGCAALEDHDQALGARPGSTCAESGAGEKAGIAAVPTTARAPFEEICDE